MQIEVFIHLWT